MTAKYLHVASVAILAAFAVGTGAARADSPGITEGDAHALFQASAGGGAAIRFHSPTLEGAPVQGRLGRISPLPSFNARHFCSLDWHVIDLTMLDVGSHQFVSAEFAPLIWNFTLDGAPLARETTAVKRADPGALLASLFDTREGYWENGGAIVSPDALAPGTHTVHLVITDTSAGGVALDVRATFVMDPAGTGVCA